MSRLPPVPRKRRRRVENEVRKVNPKDVAKRLYDGCLHSQLTFFEKLDTKYSPTRRTVPQLTSDECETVFADRLFKEGVTHKDEMLSQVRKKWAEIERPTLKRRPRSAAEIRDTQERLYRSQSPSANASERARLYQKHYGAMPFAEVPLGSDDSGVWNGLPKRPASSMSRSSSP
eukprot:NODE_5827_length_674_cov_100.767824_g5804_i0.p1 GENE.NODE_5827_length_674_cov_100.767824_g5804_i0~~NODE_5827_length_674_cov_100.767824_g5804_i0.p1  ORF type:complete len:174 (-),score=11.35 NODE_5827_length_674_cov_100.767824_g5804_i0:62-583(-)